MHHFEPAGPSASGYYWKQTATMDWCEENYAACNYIAEFWNTLSNAFFLILSLYGASMTHRLGLGHRFTLAYLGIALVGIGSWLFHMTLIYEMQLLDELPMVYVVCVLTYAMANLGIKESRGLRTRVLAWAMGLEALLFTWIYLAVPNPLIFLGLYSSQVNGLIVYSFMLYVRIKDTPETRDFKASMGSLVKVAFASYTSGGILWMADNVLCQHLRVGRTWVGWPLSLILQFHAWWHILSGFGAYCFVLLIFGLHLQAQGKAKGFDLHWRGGILPTLGLEKVKMVKMA
ncbi:ceramidase [Piptocephalis cylindrospora]|uniref:Ceramidase n=1 Tax=Piptocephalis cylindrospora TaxID=1907219 RepID=A0A4P9Y610_9FUNG|nr:ceramidase [Piptocephalis cylindrospora]|eukprot:RKP14395.1 ceramidase [Piptocephalis cylindrospora]